VDLISRASVYYVSKAVPETDRALMRRIDELRLSYPFAGNRMLCNLVRQASIEISRKHVTTLMRRLGLEALHHKPVTSRRHPSHTVFPYLLQDLSIDCANQGWATDIPYIPMHRGLLYLTVVRNWASRRVLSFRLFNALSVDFCCDTVEEALACYGVPDICNTDQGCQFTAIRSWRCYKNTTSRSAWMLAALGVTRCSSNDCGGRFSTRRGICMPTKP
jgi:putative transposase